MDGVPDRSSGASAVPVSSDPAEPGVVSAEDLAWEGPGRAPSPSRAEAAVSAGAPVLRSGGIEGPLDWLLEQARAGRIDLARLSVLALVEQCAAAVDAELARGRDGDGDGAARPARSLERPAEWVGMLAWLVWLRSRLLLPRDDPEAKAALDEAEALRRRLANQEHVQAITALLRALPLLGKDVFERPPTGKGRQGRALDLPGLLRTYARLIAPPQEPAPDTADAPYRPRPPLLWRVQDALARIRLLLLEAFSASGAQPDGQQQDGQQQDGNASLWRFLPSPEILDAALAAAPSGVTTDRAVLRRSAVAGTFLAALELARDGTLALEQEGSFGAIAVRPASVAPSSLPSPRSAEAA